MNQTGNISEYNASNVDVLAAKVFEGDVGNVLAVFVGKDSLLKDHITKTPAFLVCISGEVRFENEERLVQSMLPGDYMRIAPNVVHRVFGVEDSQLLLAK